MQSSVMRNTGVRDRERERERERDRQTERETERHLTFDILIVHIASKIQSYNELSQYSDYIRVINIKYFHCLCTVDNGDTNTYI